MPTKVTARHGDTLCSLAIQAGFENCTPLRNHPDNAEYLNRPLRRGDRVAIPDRKPGNSSGSAETRHSFKRLGVPLQNLRFVHGSSSEHGYSTDAQYRSDRRLRFLKISNYPSDKGGQYPTGPVGANDYASLPAFPNGYGYHADGDSDVDTFKIEVFDARAVGDTVKVKLKARKPVYVEGKVNNYTDFSATDPHSGSRKIEVECKRVKPGLKAFRSRYMRLVTNINDFDAIKAKKQTLLGCYTAGTTCRGRAASQVPDLHGVYPPISRVSRAGDSPLA